MLLCSSRKGQAAFGVCFIPSYPVTWRLQNGKKVQEGDRCLRVEEEQGDVDMQKEFDALLDRWTSIYVLLTLLRLQKHSASSWHTYSGHTYLQHTRKTLVLSSVWTGIAKSFPWLTLSDSHHDLNYAVGESPYPRHPQSANSIAAKVSALVSASSVLNIIPVQIHQTIRHRNWNAVGRGIHKIRISWKNPSRFNCK